MSSAIQEPKSADQMDVWITAARNGSSNALGQLLESCRQYLLLVANQELNPNIQAKVGASELVPV